MTTEAAIHELVDWLKLMDHDPADSTPLEDAVVEAIDALKAVKRAALVSGEGESRREHEEEIMRAATTRASSASLTHATTTETASGGTVPILCAMCERQFDDDEVIRVVEFRLVCEDCEHDLPEAE